MLKKALIIVLLFVFTISGVFAATTKKVKSPYKTKIIEVQTKDNHIMKAKLMYLKPPKGVKITYPTIVLLHSLGYSSSHWGNIVEELLKQNYAVLMVDLRGHGMSDKDVQFKIKSWNYFSPKTFAKYPSDVVAIINQTKISDKKASFNDYAIIGGDIGANTAVIVAQKMYPKPKAMVLLSPSVEFKGLKTATLYGISPISEIGNGPIMVMCNKNDRYFVQQETLLKKFVNGPYIVNNVDLKKNGMMILRNEPKTINMVIEFLNKNFKPQSESQPTQSKVENQKK